MKDSKVTIMSIFGFKVPDQDWESHKLSIINTVISGDDLGLATPLFN